MKRRAISPKEWRSILSYDPDTGHLFWKIKTPRRYIGQRADTRGTRGYRKISYRKTSWLAHRIVYAIVTGVEPPEHIDHINGNPSDNRLVNLRGCVAYQNAMNSVREQRGKDAAKGVRVKVKNGRTEYHAVIKHLEVTHFLGVFPSEDLARAAYQGAGRVIGSGYFCNGERRGMSLEQRIEMLDRELDALKALQHCEAS